MPNYFGPDGTGAGNSTEPPDDTIARLTRERDEARAALRAAFAEGRINDMPSFTTGDGAPLLHCGPFVWYVDDNNIKNKAGYLISIRRHPDGRWDVVVNIDSVKAFSLGNVYATKEGAYQALAAQHRAHADEHARLADKAMRQAHSTPQPKETT